MAFILSRNAKLYVSTFDMGDGTGVAGMTADNTFQVEVLDGFSFPSNTTVQDVTVSEAGAAPVRGQMSFTTSIDPVEWSFSAYVRPYVDTLTSDGGTDDVVTAPEMILWGSMAAPTYATAITDLAAAAGTSVDFGASNVHQLQKLFLYFDLGGTWYKVSNAVVDTAEFDFGIDQIAMIAWSGKADGVLELTTDPVWTGVDRSTEAVTTSGASTYTQMPVTTTAAFLTNKLSTVEVIDVDGPTTYTLALTGGNLTVTNNITFLTPESLGVINSPLDHFTGTRGVSGSMTAYLKTGGSNDTGDLYNKLSTDVTTITQDFDIILHVGGAIAAPIQLTFRMEHCHLVVPTINVEDVLALNIDFTALPYASEYDLEATNELVVTYEHPAP